MQQTIEAQIAKNTELFQTLYGIGVQNAQTLFNANQKAVEHAVSALSNVGQVPDFSKAVEAYQEAGEEITTNLEEARRVIADAFNDTREAVRTVVNSGIDNLEKQGYDAVATALRTGVSQAEAVEDHVVAQAQAVKKDVEAAQTEVRNQVKAVVAKAKTAVKTATATAAAKKK